MNLPPEILNNLREAAKRPVGTFEFIYTSKDDLFDPTIKGGIIFDLVAGKHYFRLERNNDVEILYYYSSPGTGTRVASVDLKKMKSSNKVFFAFTWSPEEINLYVGPKIQGGELVSAKGVISSKKFQIGEDGSVFQIGDDGVEVMGFSIYENGKPVLQPSAQENWKIALFSVEKLMNGTSVEGYVFESIVANQALSILITGFETYSKTRFKELEQEGIKPNIELLLSKLFSEKRQSSIKTTVDKATLRLIDYLIDGKSGKGLINFQDLNTCSKAYKIAYGLDFDKIGVSHADICKMRKIFQYRHKIIHVSSLIGMLNQKDVPSEDPVFSNKVFVLETIKLFDNFITKLNSSTLELKPKE